MKSVFAAAAVLLILAGCASINIAELQQLSVKIDPAKVDFRELSFYGERALLAYSSAAKIKKQFPNTVRVASPDGTDVQYFLELDHKAKTQYIAVRGTVDSKNFSEDLDIAIRKSRRMKIPVHAGFDAVASNVYTDIKPHLVPGYKTHLTGHSLGAAVAAIVMIYMVEDGVPVVRMVGFGQPRFTTAAGAAAIKSFPMIRVVDENDVVPMLPPSTILHPTLGPYEQVGPEVILLDGPRYVYLNKHDASRISVGEFWRSTEYAKLADHSMKRYLNRIKDKYAGAIAVSYGSRERYETSDAAPLAVAGKSPLGPGCMCSSDY
jgi:triacylglycerol lipase